MVIELLAILFFIFSIAYIVRKRYPNTGESFCGKCSGMDTKTCKGSNDDSMLYQDMESPPWSERPRLQ